MRFYSREIGKQIAQAGEKDRTPAPATRAVFAVIGLCETCNSKYNFVGYAVYGDQLREPLRQQDCINKKCESVKTGAPATLKFVSVKRVNGDKRDDMLRKYPHLNDWS